MTARRLLVTWGLLMGLTGLAGFCAAVGGTSRPGAVWLFVLAVVTVVKARLILSRYLRLEAAPSYRAGFTAAVASVIAIVTLTFILDIRLPALPRAGTSSAPYASR